MRQNLNVPQKWYDKKQPITQIEILKSIALNGFQSTTTLTEMLDSKITTINTIVGKMNDSDHSLIQVHSKKQVNKMKASHIMFSLTEKGIKVLIENQYEKLDNPYLNPKEFVTFLNRFKVDYIKQKPTKENSNWKSPKLSEKNIIDLYIKSNPKYKLVLAEEYQKHNSKLGKLLNQLKEINQKLDNAEIDLTQALLETLVNSKK